MNEWLPNLGMDSFIWDCIITVGKINCESAFRKKGHRSNPSIGRSLCECSGRVCIVFKLSDNVPIFVRAKRHFNIYASQASGIS